MKDNKKKLFVSLLLKYPVLFNKSQQFSIRLRKDQAIRDLVEDLNKLLGVALDATRVKKKIHNLKREMRVKAEAEESGNQRLLKPFERDFWKFMNSAYKAKVPAPSAKDHQDEEDEFSIIIKEEAILEDITVDEPSGSASPALEQQESGQPAAPSFPPVDFESPVADAETKRRRRTRKSDADLLEDEETRKLSTSKLLRLVLLEQLKLTRMQMAQVEAQSAAKA